MSELNTNDVNPEELVEEVGYTVNDATVIPTPIDPTLTIEGEAADAKATGDAIASVFVGATVNGKSATNKAFIVYAGDILLSSEQGAQTVLQAIDNVVDKDASQIIYDQTELITVKDAIDGIKTEMDTELTEEQIDEIINDVFGGED